MTKPRHPRVLENRLEFEGYSVESAETVKSGLATERAYLRSGAARFACPIQWTGDFWPTPASDRKWQYHDTAYGTLDNAVRAMQKGANKLYQKPWDNESSG